MSREPHSVVDDSTRKLGAADLADSHGAECQQYIKSKN